MAFVFIDPWSQRINWVTLAGVGFVLLIGPPQGMIMGIRTNEIILPDFWTRTGREIFTRTVYVNCLTALRQWIACLTITVETILTYTFKTLSGINVVKYVTVTFCHNSSHQTMHHHVPLLAFEPQTLKCIVGIHMIKFITRIWGWTYEIFFVVRWSLTVWSISTICIDWTTSTRFTFIHFDNFLALIIFILSISRMANTMIFRFRYRETIRWSRTGIICANVVWIINSITFTTWVEPPWMWFCAEFRSRWTFFFSKMNGFALPSFLIPVCISFVLTTNINFYD